MGNTTLDMQASLNPQGGIALFMKAQDKSHEGSRPAQSNSFISVLDEKTAEAINDEANMEKINEDPDNEAMNSDFAAIPVLNPIRLGMAHRLRKDTPLSETEDMKSVPFLDKLKLPVLSIPTAKNRGYLTEDKQQAAMPVPTGMKDEANHALLEDPCTGITKSSFTAISEIIQSQPVIIPQSGENASIAGAMGIKNQLQQLQTTDLAGQASHTEENSDIFKMVSASLTEEKASRAMDQSTPIPTLGLPGFRAGNHAKSEIPLTTENRGQTDQAQTNNTLSKAVSVTLGATVADTPIPGLDSSSGDHVINHIRAEKSGRKAEAGSMDRVSELLRQKEDKSAADGLFPDLHRATLSHRDSRIDSVAQKERHVAIANQKPTAAVNDRVAAIEPSPSKGLTQVELTDTAVFMKSSPAGTTAADQDNQQSWNVSREHHHRTMNQDEFPLRAEMTHILSGSGNRLKASDGPAGIDAQAVIDQILDAKQSLNNGFGRVRITLDPPNLGTVNLEIVIRKERVNVVMTADNSNVQQALQSRVDDIRTALQRQDLKIENFQILLQDNSANQQQTNSSATFGQRQEQRARQNHTEDGTLVQPLIQPIRESGTARGLVSIFV